MPVVHGATLGTRAELSMPEKKEHFRNIKTAAKGSRIANHTRSHNHAIEFENASVIDKGGFRTGKTLEVWHAKLTPNADNNSCPLPGEYNILLKNRGWKRNYWD